MSEIEFSDEELVAYLDGESDYAPMDDIAIALRTDRALAKRLEALRVDTKQISASYDASFDLNKKLTFNLGEASEPRWSIPGIAASILFVGVAFGIFQYWLQPQERDWKDYVAAYQFLYTTSTLSNVQNSLTVQQQELDRVGAAIAKKIPVAALAGFPEVEYKRAQLLGYKGKALIQLTFLSGTGEPIALCILRIDGQKNQAPEFTELEGMRAANWKMNGYDYLLIGGQDEVLIERMATSFEEKKI